MQTRQLNYRPDIDGLRAIAVSSVVLSHAELGFPGGYVGVDVFFTISGYLIASLILRDLERKSFSFRGFWERRVRRILPALFTVVTCTIIAGWFLLIPAHYALLGRSVVSVACLVPNIFFWKETGYFAPGAEEMPLLHTWSLGVEEQFYLFFPLLLMVLYHRQKPREMIAVLSALAMMSFGISVYGTYYHPFSTFYWLPTRAWELLAGVLLAFLPESTTPRLSRASGIIAVLGLAAILIPCFVYGQRTRFPGAGALPPVVGTAFAILAGRGRALSLPSRLLAVPPVRFIGLISYSLYLWHWPLFAFAKYRSPEPLTISTRLLLVFASVVLATGTWRYVEVVFRDRKTLPTRSSFLVATFTSYAALIIVGGMLARRGGFPSRLSAQAQLYLNTAQEKIPKEFHRTLDVDDVPENLIRVGATDSPPRFVLWGDSHLMVLLPMIDDLCKRASISGVAATYWATAPASGDVASEPGTYFEQGVAFNAAILDYIRAARIRNVILVAYWAKYEAADVGGRLQHALLATVRRLQTEGVTVYFVKDVADFRFEVAKFLVIDSNLDMNPLGRSMSIAEYAARNKFQAALVTQLREQHVPVLDPIPCFLQRTDTTEIVPFDAHGSFYSDSNHLSIYGSRVLQPLFAEVIEKIQ
jgi:peptidoglycan/LPS O-acetylase OafA/YrhL